MEEEGEAWCPQGAPVPNPLTEMAKLDYTRGSRGHTQGSAGCAWGGETERPWRGQAASDDCVLQDRQPLTHSFQWTQG